jgi:hypothetical protein
MKGVVLDKILSSNIESNYYKHKYHPEKHPLINNANSYNSCSNQQKKASEHFICSISFQTYKNSILQAKILRHQEVKKPARGYTASKSRIHICISRNKVF